MDKVTELVTTYSVADGQDQGYYSSSYEYSSTGASGSGGTPGTDSNSEETDYMIQSNGGSNSETILNKYNYLPNEDVKNIEHEVGAVVPEESSMGVVLIIFHLKSTQNRIVIRRRLKCRRKLPNLFRRRPVSRRIT